MPVERIPGEKMYIDWVGDPPELLTDPSTEEILKHMNDSDHSFLDNLLPWSKRCQTLSENRKNNEVEPRERILAYRVLVWNVYRITVIIIP